MFVLKNVLVRINSFSLIFSEEGIRAFKERSVARLAQGVQQAAGHERQNFFHF